MNLPFNTNEKIDTSHELISGGLSRIVAGFTSLEAAMTAELGADFDVMPQVAQTTAATAPQEARIASAEHARAVVPTIIEAVDEDEKRRQAYIDYLDQQAKREAA